LPAIACDIDGVILRGSQIIGNSDKMIRQVLAPRTELDPSGKLQMPFTLLTNGGGFIEERKAEEINYKLHYDKEPESSPMKLNYTQVIQCHTPLREEALVS
jgi:ribonucleotide monophosphatase NagD (HAD superfamily)